VASYSTQVFLNVPFDRRYNKLRDALVFSVHDCGLTIRCALESDDGAEIRFAKLVRLIRECRFGIHDLSRTTLDSTHRLPRFNMPLELGLFLGAKLYGSDEQPSKACLILERDAFRYQKYCSDIAGQDIRGHGNDVLRAITAVRNWLQANLTLPSKLAGPAKLRDRYLEFRRQLPYMCRVADLTPAELTFLDYRNLVSAWVEENPR